MKRSHLVATLVVVAAMAAVASARLPDPYISPMDSSPINECDPQDAADTSCFLSCKEVDQRQRLVYLVDRLQKLDDTKYEGVLVRGDGTRRPCGTDPTMVGATGYVSLTTCKSGGHAAVKSKDVLLKAAGRELPLPLQEVEGPPAPPCLAPNFPTHPSGTVPADQKCIGPCLDGVVTPFCFVSCNVMYNGKVQRAPGYLAAAAGNKMVFYPVLSTAREVMVLDAATMDGCKQSASAYAKRGFVPGPPTGPQAAEAVRVFEAAGVPVPGGAQAAQQIAPAAAAVGPPAPPSAVIGESNAFRDLYPGRTDTAERGVPIGGHKVVALKDIYAVLEEGAPLTNLKIVRIDGTAQRLAEPPYELPMYRIELNPVTGGVFVSMPVSKRWMDAHPESAPTDVSATTYIDNMFSEHGTLPRGVQDMLPADREFFNSKCQWNDAAYLWAVAPVMNADGHGVNAQQFRIILSPECAYTHRRNPRLIKHGDLVPLLTPEGLFEGRRGSEQEKIAHQAKCHAAGEAFLDGQEGYLEPSWSDDTNLNPEFDPEQQFRGTCRGPAHMAGELYPADGARGHIKESKHRMGAVGMADTRANWLFDADSSYAFLRDNAGDLAMGVPVMNLMLAVMAAMKIDMTHAFVNGKATSPSDPEHADRQIPLRIPKTVVKDMDDVFVTPLAGDYFPFIAPGQSFGPLYTPLGAEEDGGFPAVLPWGNAALEVGVFDEPAPVKGDVNLRGAVGGAVEVPN